MDRSQYEKFQVSVSEAIEYFVTANRLMMNPQKITKKGAIYDNDDLIISWTNIAFEYILPVFHRIRNTLDVSLCDLGDLGLGRLGEAVIGMVGGLDDFRNNMKHKTFQNTPHVKYMVDWGIDSWLSRLINIVVENGVDIYNEYLEYCIDRNVLISCAKQGCLVKREDMNELCAWAEYKYASCFDCKMKEPELPLPKGEIWLQITLPEPPS